MKKIELTALGILALATAGAATGPTLIVSTWDLGADGDWNVASNWDPTTVPDNNGSEIFDVVIDGSGADVVVTLPIVVDVNTLTISAGDQLFIPNAPDLTIRGGSLTNDGILSMNSSGSVTNLLFDGDSSISGTGSIVFGGHALNRITVATTNQVVTNEAGHTIEGGGSFGINTTTIVNHGLVDANSIIGPLDIDPATAIGATNTGILRASDGGQLNLSAAMYDNTTGIIEALDGSVVATRGTLTIMGGEISSSGSGIFECQLNTPRFVDITNNADFRIANAIDPIIESTLVNNASITFDTTSSVTSLRFDGAVTLSGGGEIHLASDSSNSSLAAITTGDRLTNVDNLIHGAGAVGLNTLSVTNGHRIVADNPVTELIVDPPTSGDLTNNGTLEANGGTLRLSSGIFDNTNGSIQAYAGSVVELGGTLSILGGTLESFGDGAIHVTANTVQLVDVVNDADLHINNAMDPLLVGTFTNNVSVSINSTGALNQLRMGGDVTLQGGGVINMANSAATNRIEAQTTLDRLTNVDNTIRGSGTIGVNSLSLTNHHIIQADDAATQLILDPPTSGDFTNNHLFHAIDGATLHLNAGEYLNSGSEIVARDGSFVEFGAGANLTGGTLRSEGSGQVLLSGTQTMTDVTNDADLRIANAVDPVLASSFINLATLTFDGTGSITSLRCSGDISLTGGGTIDLGATTANRIEAITTGDRCTNVDNLIRGGGSIGMNTLSFTNESTIRADHPTVAIQIDPPTGGDFLNTGTMHAQSDAGIDLLAGPFDNQGEVQIDANSRIDRSGNDYVQTSGTTTVEGILDVGNVNAVIEGGSLRGTGTVEGTLVTDGGSIDPGMSAGTLNVDGSFEPTINGALNIELAGLLSGEFDVLAIDGEAHLGGSLNVTAIDGYVPNKGDEFTILTATDGVFGVFDTVSCTNFVIHYESNAVRIEILSAVNIADINCDGSVDVSDLLILLAEWGPCGEGPCGADINNSGAVEIDDLLLLLANWGA